MKKKLCILVLLLPLSGCYTPARFPLVPGDKVIFTTAERANAFRAASGNDIYNTGSVVKIDRPTGLTKE